MGSTFNDKPYANHMITLNAPPNDGYIPPTLTPPELEKKPEKGAEEKTLISSPDDTQEVPYSVDEWNPPIKNRVQWSSEREFLLTCIGYSVGLGNVWRFPYLCYKNGGGAFLIPYMIMIFSIGLPLLFMEYSFGQFFGIGSLSIFERVCPLFKGIGVGYLVLNALVGIYYNVIIAISIHYIFSSFTKVVPWSTCGNYWNSENCGEPGTGNSTNATALWNSTWWNSTWCDEGTANETLCNMSLALKDAYNDSQSQARTSPSDECFRFGLMNETEETTVDNIGNVQWQLALCLMLAWTLVALFVSKGIKSTGKVSYITATFPYVMLTVLVVRGVTLEGAREGLKFFIVPDFNLLKSPEVWYAAATQLFYSVNLAWGGMITMSSYNNPRHNCFRDAIVINFVSFGTSVYAGLAVFSVIGFMANEYNVNVTEVIKSGPGLAFVAYPRALSLMPLAQLWSVLFFFMLFLLGIGSQMVQVETIMTGIMDNWRRLALQWKWRYIMIVLICSTAFLLGLPCTTQGGMFVLDLMDRYSAGYCVLVIAILECIIIAWIYGTRQMKKNIEMMGLSLNIVFRVCWAVISPLLILIVLCFSFYKYERPSYGGKFFPVWSEVLGAIMTLASNIPIVVVAVIVLYKTPGATLLQKLRKSVKCTVTDAEIQARFSDDDQTRRTIIEHEIICDGGEKNKIALAEKQNFV